jgi:CDP-glycerol glycerophosphotransferase
MYYHIIKTNISYAIASSAYFQIIIARFLDLPLEKVLIAGQSRNDQLFIESDLDMQNFSKEKMVKSILYAPTWRPSSPVVLFPFKDFCYQTLADFLSENDIHIFIRVHPNFEEDVDSKLLEISNIHLFSGVVYDEIMDYLNKFDLLITDYSSIYFDYLLLDRPLIFLPYDYDTYDKEIGFTIPYGEFTPGYKPVSMEELMNAIQESFDMDKYKDERDRINTICNSIKKDNRQELVKLLCDKSILS